MTKKTAAELITEAELEFSQLPGFMKGQAGAVMLPLIGAVRLLSADFEGLRGRVLPMLDAVESEAAQAAYCDES